MKKSGFPFFLAISCCLWVGIGSAPPNNPKEEGKGQPKGSIHVNAPHNVPHPSIRTPSMSRESIPHNTPAKAPNSFNRKEVRQQLAQYVNNVKRPANQKTMNTFAQQRQAFHNVSQNASKQIGQQHPNYHNWFNEASFHQHKYFPRYWHQGSHWWVGPGWGGVTAWLGGAWAAPIYYDDEGNPYEVTDTQNIPSPSPVPAEGDWLPLGVFAAGQNPAQAAFSNMFVQLAVDRDGDLDGTYYNASTESYHPLEGYIDQSSQQAVWRLADNQNSPVMTTGIYNLTQDQASILVHFPDGSVQNWVLVRVNPEAGHEAAI